jgi:hypothetical protein
MLVLAIEISKNNPDRQTTGRRNKQQARRRRSESGLDELLQNETEVRTLHPSTRETMPQPIDVRKASE